MVHFRFSWNKRSNLLVGDSSPLARKFASFLRKRKFKENEWSFANNVLKPLWGSKYRKGIFYKGCESTFLNDHYLSVVLVKSIRDQ